MLMAVLLCVRDRSLSALFAVLSKGVAIAESNEERLEKESSAHAFLSYLRGCCFA